MYWPSLPYPFLSILSFYAMPSAPLSASGDQKNHLTHLPVCSTSPAVSVLALPGLGALTSFSFEGSPRPPHGFTEGHRTAWERFGSLIRRTVGRMQNINAKSESSSTGNIWLYNCPRFVYLVTIP